MSRLDPFADELTVTGEAVALEVRPATVAARMGSGLIDRAISVVLMLALILLASRFVENASQLQIAVVVVLAAGTLVLPVAVETITRGQSAGKIATGVRIVRTDGGPVRFRHAFVRGLLGTVEVWLTLGAAAVLASILDKRARRVGDMLAGTYAISTRGTEIAMAPLLLPPELSGWARTVDIGRVPDSLAARCRLFLARSSGLNAGVRQQAATGLAATMEPYVSPPPPWGTHPERFLAATLVARRDRQFRAAVANEGRVDAVAHRTRQVPFDIPEVR